MTNNRDQIMMPLKINKLKNTERQCRKKFGFFERLMMLKKF